MVDDDDVADGDANELLKKINSVVYFSLSLYFII